MGARRPGPTARGTHGAPPHGIACCSCHPPLSAPAAYPMHGHRSHGGFMDVRLPLVARAFAHAANTKRRSPRARGEKPPPHRRPRERGRCRILLDPAHGVDSAVVRRAGLPRGAPLSAWLQSLSIDTTCFLDFLPLATLTQKLD